MKSTHLLSSNAFSYKWPFKVFGVTPRAPTMTGTPFFSSREALFLISLALCSLVSLSLYFQRFDYRQAPQCLRCGIFCFSFHEQVHQAYGNVCHECISMVKSHNISALLHSQWLLQSCVGTNCTYREIKHLTNFPRTTRAKVSRLFLQSLCALHMQKASSQDHLFSSGDLVWRPESLPLVFPFEPVLQSLITYEITKHWFIIGYA